MRESADLETTACLCGNADNDVVKEAVDPIERGSWTYRCCPVCTLERLSPRPQISMMGRYYPDDYAPFADPAPQQASRADRVKRAVYETYFATPAERSAAIRRVRPLMLALLLPLRQHSVLSFEPPALPRRVYEFGAGTGADLIEFRNAGWEVSGCEPSAVGVAAAAAHGVMLQQCNAEAA